MILHPTTFEYLKPTDVQIATMSVCRNAAHDYARVLDQHLPDGPDKAYVLRLVRDTAMWANVAITREADGTPRSDQ